MPGLTRAIQAVYRLPTMPTDAVLPAASRRPRVRRVPVVVLLVVVVTAWVVLSFGRTLSALNDVNQRAAALAAEKAALEMQLQQGRAEMELAQTPAFQRMMARSFGMGLPGERAFALEPDAPPPPVVTPLGGHSATDAGPPLDAWLRILFGD